MTPPDKVVFFDGVCVMCDSFVDRLIKWDRRKILRFASLQGETAKQLLPNELSEGRSTICYMRHSELLIKSDAVLAIIHDLKGGWVLLYPLRWVPRFVRDGIYGWISKNRYKSFGKLDSCRLPSDGEKGLILP